MKIALLARWTARLAATGLTGLFIAFLVQEGAPDLRAIEDREIGQFAALFVMVIGTLVAWRRDLAGALLLLAGYGVFAYLEGGWPPLAFAPYLLAAALLLLSAAIRWIAARRRTAPATPAGPAAAPQPAARVPPVPPPPGPAA